MITWLHKVLRPVLAALATSWLAALMGDTTWAADEAGTTRLGGLEVHGTRIIAKYREGFRSRADQSVIGSGDNLFRTRRKFSLVPGLVVLDEQDAKVAGTATSQRLSNPKDVSTKLAARIQFLRQSGQFEYVEPDYIVHTTAITPSDSAFQDGTLWGLRNTGQSNGVAGADIAASAAWSITTGSSNIIVATVDTGIRYTHQDLIGNLWRNPGEIPGNGIDDDGDGYIDNVFGVNTITGSGDPFDDNGHGTHVSGTIGATANGGGPHVGVNWNVRLMACKFLGASGTGNSSDAVEAIDFAVTHGARIISASYGSLGFSQATFDAIQRARDAGVLFVAAAGNGGSDGNGDDNDSTPFYPASYNLNNIISVAALDRSDKLSSFSNYGRTNVDIGAPGSQIYSTYDGSDTDYRTMSGTSMATPHVSGIAALVLSRYPEMSLTELRQTLLDSAVPIAALSNRCVTGGRVSAFNAVNVSPQGTLNLTVSLHNGDAVLAGRPIVLAVNVGDRGGVTNATVTVTLQDSSVVSLRNDGISPDTTAGDANYFAWLSVPAQSDTFTFTINATAPGKTGTTLVLNCPVVTPEVNDDFDKATLVSGAQIHITGSNRNAGKEAGEPSHGGNPGGRSIWYAWTAPASGLTTVSASASSFDTLVAVYTGSTLADVHLVGETADDWQQNSKATHASFNAVEGITYRIAVDGRFGASGDVDLSLELLPVLPPPANDAFASRIPLLSHQDGGYLVAGAFASTRGATRESAEPLHAGVTGGLCSVWYSWTAPSNGIVTVRTTNNSFDTLLAVYTNNSLQTLQSVVSNDDASASTSSSTVTFRVVAGRVYQIAIDGWDGASGSTSLAVELRPEFSGTPSNNNFSLATVLSGRSAVAFGANALATKEGSEPNHAGNQGGRSVWWQWTAPVAGTATVSTAGSDFDTLLGIYQGTTVSALTVVATNNDASVSDTTSVASFNTVSGQIYRIAVDGFKNNGSQTFAQTGHIVLKIDLANGTAPGNNAFANRFAVSGNSISTNGINIGATVELPDEPAHARVSGGKSIWWTWTPAASGLTAVSTEGSTFDTSLAVYTGSSLGGLTEVGSNDDDPRGGRSSLVMFNAQAGTPYQIAIDGKGGTFGLAALRITNITGSPVLTPQILFHPQSQTVSTGSSLELVVSAAGSYPLHYQWYRDNTVLPGATAATLTIPNIRIAQAGSYRVVVGDLTAEVSSREAVVDVTAGTVPTNDLFANRITINPAGDLVYGRNVGATVEPNEPAHHQLRTRHSVWWTWTAPSASRYSISTIGSNFDTVLGVYTGTGLSTLVKVASSDDPQNRGRGAWVVLEAASGQTYQIAVDGFNEATGSIHLSVLPAAKVQFGITSSSNSTAFRSSFTGEAGIYYWIQASTNLVGWQTISNIQATGVPLEFGDPFSTNYPFRFYRIVQEP